MEKPSLLLSLSDEVLLHIFSYLDGIDKINTFRTCVRFSSVLCDRRLSRKLKLIGNYGVTLKEIKLYLKPNMIRQHIRMLDLTNCYWLQPSEVCAAVLNLKNLIAFYSVDVDFTFNQIIKIVNGFPKLKCLSFSWPAVSTIEDVTDECLGSLVLLYMYFPKVANTNWFHVIYWICRCKNLKQLWLTAAGNDLLRPIISTTGQSSCSEFILDTLVIAGLKNAYLLHQLRHTLRISSETCKCLWLPVDTHAWQDYFNENEDGVHCRHFTTWGTCLESLAHRDQRMSLGLNGKIRRFYWSKRNQPFCAGDQQFENIEELKIKFCFSLTLLQPLHILTVLCIPSCCFSDPEGKLREEVQLFPKWCPEIQHFELYLCEQCCRSQHGCEESKSLLEMIAEWPKLRTLKLIDCWNLRCGKAFDKIFKSCKNLEKLFLRKLGAQYGYVFEFTKALKNCKKLKDFRFEENFVPSVQMRQLFEALAECPLIERVVVDIQHTEKYPIDALVLNLIERSPKLIFLCIITPNLQQSQKKRLIKTITKEFAPMRPALHCCFMKCIDNSEKDNVPAVHLFEMLLPDMSGPFELPYKKDFFFEVPNLDVAAYGNVL